MSTINNTYPDVWEYETTYSIGDRVTYGSIIYRSLVNDNQGKIPFMYNEYWKAIDIFSKDASVMDDEYSGDTGIWERDQLYIDDNGDVYINNERTGINVKGPKGDPGNVDFSSLTPEQKAMLKGDKGEDGADGRDGTDGQDGRDGTDGQDGADGKSAYEVWLDYHGYNPDEHSVLEFLQSLVGPAATIDTEMDATSGNPVANSTLVETLTNLTNSLMSRITELEERVENLESKLTYRYQGEEVWFDFGVTAEGLYGYIKRDEVQVTPFETPDGNPMTSSFVQTSTILQGNFGKHIQQEGVTTVPNMRTMQPASIQQNPSSNVEEIDNTIYATGVEILNFTDAFNLYTDIFNHGKFDRYGNTGNATLYEMIYNYDATKTDEDEAVGNTRYIIGNPVLYSGLYFTDKLKEVGNTIYFEIEPVTEGATVEYEIGNSTGSYDSDGNWTGGTLPSVAGGTKRESYSRGSFNSPTIVSRDINGGQGVYIAATTTTPFKIKRIYTS